MKVLVRILAAVVLLLGAAALLLSVAGGIGIWIVKGPATAKATRVFERIDAALDIADQALAQGNTSLARAAERLDNSREEHRRLAQQPMPNTALLRTLSRTVQRTVAPEIGNAHEKLHTVAEAAVVVNAVLEDVGNLPFLSVTGLDIDRLTEMNSGLADVGPAAWELSRLLGEPEPDSGAARNQLSRVEQSLVSVRGMIGEFERPLTEVRQRTEALKARTLPWITPASLLISLACFWIALSQLSVLAHAWSWWRRAGETNPRPS
jgi:hypothetical protein